MSQRQRILRATGVALLALCGAAHAAIPASERAALLDLYNSTGGNSAWIYNLNWNGAAGTECGAQNGTPAWFGVTCDAANSHVVSLYLAQNNLTGSLPASLSALTQLQTLNLSTNSLSGPIPSLAGMNALAYVSLEENSLSGSIPALTSLTALVGFDVSANELTGSVPALTGLSKLQGFNVSINRLSGSLPALTDAPALQVVDVHANSLTGTLPAFTQLSQLQAFYAQGNQIGGALPAFDGLGALQFFNVHGNALSGAIPSLSGLASIKTLDLGANAFSGALPTLTGLGTLNAIDVGGNALTGTLPPVPAVNALVAGASVVCSNNFTATASTDWDRATGVTPWYAACGLTLTTLNLDQRGLTGAWYHPGTGGQGFLIETYKDFNGAGQGYLAAGWYTFDVTASGGQRWYTLQGPAVSGAASVPLGIFQSTGGNFAATPKISSVQVGSATLSFSDCNTGSLAYSFNDGRSGTIALSRADTNITCSLAGDTTAAPQNYLLSGAWYDPATSGQGFFFDINPALNLLFAGWYTYAPNGSGIGGGASQRWYTIQDNAFAPGTATKSNLAVYETTGGVFNTGQVNAGAPVGTATVTINSCSSLSVSYSFSSGTNAGKSGTIALSRVVNVPAGCTSP